MVDIDKCINSVVNEVLRENKNAGAGLGPDELENIALIDLVKMDLNDDIKLCIYERFKNDIDLIIDDFLVASKDPNADKGMFKCSLETWQACSNNIGLKYFRKYKYLHDYKRERQEGGARLKDDLLFIALELYEYYCQEFRKQYFIYDCCRFMGVDMDLMYRLSELHSIVLKKAHTKQESSMRTALASGRSNVTAMAILLNHDYDYTRTTQVIHTNNNSIKCADDLPALEGPRVQHIVIEENNKNAAGLPDGL